MSQFRPNRKRLRLKDHDYSQPGWYFVTVCTANREYALGHPVGADVPIGPRPTHPVRPDVLIGPQTELSEYGKIVERVSSQMPTVEKFAIMPDHVHIIFRIPEPQDGLMRTSAPTLSLPGLVRYWKRQITQQCGVNLWQRSYYDHVIRDEADYRRIWSYIETNPAKWKELHDTVYAP